MSSSTAQQLFYSEKEDDLLPPNSDDSNNNPNKEKSPNDLPIIGCSSGDALGGTAGAICELRSCENWFGFGFAV
ncbi:MAG: hypothetical protein FWC80_04895 [Firmicutes bacterium]|nr:hypothetical protein [Bacillota bacterium]